MCCSTYSVGVNSNPLGKPVRPLVLEVGGRVNGLSKRPDARLEYFRAGDQATQTKHLPART